MTDIYDIVSFFDKCRWTKYYENYGLINYFKDNLSNDLKLLTHWISYITDRQIGYEIVWDVGGFVFSEMLYYYRKPDVGLEVLNPKSEFAFFKIDDETGKYSFVSKKKISNKLSSQSQRLLKKYNLEDGKCVKYISRFYPADYKCMLYTMHTLEYYHKSLVDYIADVLKNVKNQTSENLVKTLVYALSILTYDDIKKTTKEDLIYKRIFKEAESRTKKVMAIVNDKDLLEKNTNKFFKSGKQYKNKRIWCCVRDYIKSEVFGTNCLKQELIRKGLNNTIISKLYSKEALSFFELPGDVWNNNLKFINCLFKDAFTDKNKKEFNKCLRKEYEDCRKRNKEANWYPEQFDFSFDFVPKMCKMDNCDVCPFKYLIEKNNLEKICAKNNSKYCTVALICCGYKCKCSPCDCLICKSFDK